MHINDSVKIEKLVVLNKSGNNVPTVATTDNKGWQISVTLQ